MNQNKENDKENIILTIASVRFSLENEMLVDLNHDLTSAKNSARNWRWIVADNTPPGSAHKLSEEKFIVVHGAVVPSHVPHTMRGSYHHGSALNNILPFVRTRFFMVMDNDFFVVRPEWIDEIIGHMEKNKLAFFGTSYNPKRYGKYRYFPSANQFCVFDLARMDIKKLDFRPQYAQIEENLKKEAQQTTSDPKTGTIAKGEAVKKMLWETARIIIKTFFGAERLKIGASRDTGYAIYKRYGKSALRSECVQSVFKPTSEGLFEKFLPERLSFIPKRRGYYTDKGFSDRGYPDAAAHGWEEYIWKEAPFGIHLRKNRWEKPEEKMQEIRDYLRNFYP